MCQTKTSSSPPVPAEFSADHRISRPVSCTCSVIDRHTRTDLCVSSDRAAMPLSFHSGVGHSPAGFLDYAIFRIALFAACESWPLFTC